ncbi:hypothetical protein BDK51DRAFT_32719 [Blyttiomyces helicus]|uniref:Uncharacterized protein n=1 Tax=Blyttiomyces helicus TaxID=388810 RepID=A0A4P9WTE0_9FUNG|nr:hypothetical protein BDK51DRAFT_32719 [Blyttiomyces helicus]|eukprot:RKO94326.1 hypothetical protein BDK51DRAFT_32719 [Blyttiomyces helicus]
MAGATVADLVEQQKSGISTHDGSLKEEVLVIPKLLLMEGTGEIEAKEKIKQHSLKKEVLEGVSETWDVQRRKHGPLLLAPRDVLGSTADTVNYQINWASIFHKICVEGDRVGPLHDSVTGEGVALNLELRGESWTQDNFCQPLDAVAQLLVAIAHLDLNFMRTSQKFHTLLHLSEDLRCFGLAPLYATEQYVSFNSVNWAILVHFNGHAPSRDVSQRGILQGGEIRVCRLGRRWSGGWST